MIEANQPKYKMTNKRPTAKASAAAFSAALATVIMWALNTFAISDPSHVITGEVGAAFTAILSFTTAYFVRPGADDQIVEETKS